MSNNNGLRAFRRVIPEWGLFGFITATMLSSIGTHMILYHHRKLMYSTTITVKDVSQEGENEDGSPPVNPSLRGLQQVTGMSMRSAVMLTILLITGTALYLAGCLLDIFRITNTRGPFELEPDNYSIVSVGRELPKSARDEDRGAMRWLQILWFFSRSSCTAGYQYFVGTLVVDTSGEKPTPASILLCRKQLCLEWG